MIPSQAVDAAWRDPARLQRARRSAAVRVAKYVLPVVALGLLSAIALWPEISRTLENGRVTWKRLTMIREGAGTMVGPRYRGLDGSNRPYTVSADSAQRDGPLRVNLTAPVGDVSLPNGTWMLLKAPAGVFMQHSNELDLSHGVTLYRQDGTTMTADTATINMAQGAATSNDFTHAEGPFGTLDAEGFTLVDKGQVIQFRGPARLVINAVK